jgi:hypothetical protein
MSDKLQFVVYFGESLSRDNDTIEFVGHFDMKRTDR